MPRGLPDSWGLWAARRASRAFRNQARRSASNIIPGGTTVYTIVKVTPYPAALKSFLDSPAGPLWGQVEKRARLAQLRAKKQAGFKTGRLRASIYKNHTMTSYGQKVEIGSNVDYAFNHHQGTRPHVIVGSPGKNLVFVKNGRVINTKSVFHPGTKPNPYLSNQLKYFVKPRIVIR